jgi:glycerol-3-phosphate acyltransferase PlsY
MNIRDSKAGDQRRRMVETKPIANKENMAACQVVNGSGSCQNTKYPNTTGAATTGSHSSRNSHFGGTRFLVTAAGVCLQFSFTMLLFSLLLFLLWLDLRGTAQESRTVTMLVTAIIVSALTSIQSLMLWFMQADANSSTANPQPQTPNP